MDYLWQIHYDYSWGGLFTNALIIGLVYLILYLGSWFMHRVTAPSFWQQSLQRNIDHVLLVFESVTMLLLFSYFVLIKPFYHGLIVILLMITNFRHLRNYFSGTILRFHPAIREGNRLDSNGRQGVITEVGRLGIKLQDNKGVHFQDYEQLWNKGYSLLNSEDSGRFFQLQISAASSNEDEKHHKNLQRLVANSPYINWLHQPKLTIVNQENHRYLLQLAVFEEQHLTDFIERLEEDHFTCKIAKR
ncbi:MAG: hypothetical protein AAGJ93_05170 [Bacteroidota bacterium]